MKIRPLEWIKQDGPADYWTADSPFGRYGVGIDFDGVAYGGDVPGPGKWIDYSSLDDAKAACAADHERRATAAVRALLDDDLPTRAAADDAEGGAV